MQKFDKVGEALYEKLKNPFWASESIPKSMRIVQGTEGAFNIFWALMGRPPLGNLYNYTAQYWRLAKAISKLSKDGAELEYSATVLSLEEFADFIAKDKFRFKDFPVVTRQTILKGLLK